jgi:hypothetical protein
LIGLDNSHLMPKHMAESSRLTSHLGIIRLEFGSPYILVGEGAPKFSWYDEAEASKRSEARAHKRQKRAECRKLLGEARQEALKNIHKSPKELREGEGERKTMCSPEKGKQVEKLLCKPLINSS